MNTNVLVLVAKIVVHLLKEVQFLKSFAWNI